MELKREFPGQFNNKLLIGVSFRSADAMMEVRDGEHNAEVFSQFQQEPQQSYRIRPAGDGDCDALTCLQKVLLANVFEYFFPHGLCRTYCGIIVR